MLTILCCHAILCFAFGEISLNPSIRSIHFFRPNFRHVNPSRNGKSCILDPNMLPVSISLSHLFRSEYWVIVYHCIYILQRMHFLSGGNWKTPPILQSHCSGRMQNNVNFAIFVYSSFILYYLVLRADWTLLLFTNLLLPPSALYFKIRFILDTS